MNKRGFAPILILLAAVVVLAVVGGVWYWGSHRSNATNSTPKQTVVDAPASLSDSGATTNSLAETSIAEWKTYINNQHGYTIQYPPGIDIVLVGTGDAISAESVTTSAISTTTVWYASTCINVSQADTPWYINISTDSNFSQVPCGPTGTAADDHPVQDSLMVAGENITTHGISETNHADASFRFNLGKIYVNYGIASTSTVGLSDEDYQNNLKLMHAIIATLKPIQNFVPSAPPDNGRG